MGEGKDVEEDATVTKEKGQQEPQKEKLKASENEYKTFDFNRLTTMSDEQMHRIQLIHEAFSKSATMALSAQLANDSVITVESIEQLSFDAYLESLTSPTCIVSVDMLPLHGYGILEVNSDIAFSFVDRKLGGEGEVPESQRPLTDLELAIAKKMVNLFLNDLSEAWTSILNVRFGLKKMETNPEMMTIIPLRELCLVTRFNVITGDAKGEMTFCLPYVNLEPIVSLLNSEQWNSKGTVHQSEEIKAAHTQNLLNVDVDFKAVLGDLQISMFDLLSLQQGDVLNLNHKVHDSIDLYVVGKKKFQGNPGLLGKNKGVSIQNNL